MENPYLTPPPPPEYITGSRGGDRLVGIAAGIAWWAAGVYLGALTSGGVIPVILIGFLVHAAVLGRRRDGRVMLISLFVTAVAVPCLVFLGLFGMCAVGGMKL